MTNPSQVMMLPGGAIPAGVGLVQYVFRNATTNFRVSYDNALGASGPVLADAVLATCEGDLAAMIAWFGVNLPANELPVTIYIDVGTFGAYHGSCPDTALHLAAFDGNDSNLVRMLLVAELDECFMAAQGKWNCGSSSGEGLSRVLATERYPHSIDGFVSAPTWLDGGRPDWVDNTEGTDRNYPSIGCSVLFLNYLHYQLTFSWSAIIAAGASTLAGTYTALTGKTDGWAQFTSLVAYKYPAGTPSGVTTDNIFPIARIPTFVGGHVPILRLAWAWIIVVGGIIIWPGGVGCIVCGSPLNLPGDIGHIVTTAIGFVSMLLGVYGFATNSATGAPRT